MIEIPIPETVKVGGFDLCVDSNLKADEALSAKNAFGDHCPFVRRIRVLSTLSGQEWNNTFLHEIGEAIANIYLPGKLEHFEIEVFINALHQVIEGLGVRFVRRAE